MIRPLASTRPLARGFASSARALSEAASSSAPAPASAAPRPRTTNPSQQRSSQSGQRNRDRPPRREGSQNNIRNGGGERRGKRLPSVFDAASSSNESRAGRGSNVKSLTQGSRKMPAPLPKTDWNNPLFSKPGFERSLASAPRPSSIFVPSLAAAAPSASASGGKGKGKAAAAPVKSANDKLNLPGIKTANSALKLHLRPGARNILGPMHHPTGVAAGFLSQNRVVLPRSTDVKASDDKSLAAELKAARIALQDEQIGGSYDRFQTQSVLKAAGVPVDSKGASISVKAVQDAAQALAVNPDVAPEGKHFVTKTISERLSA
ncbi:hypothetical protein PSEUBRA_003421 [Kalmanozyma brasiliensis GHG001]|uniref:Uncharacterized protein n=1 Tax=Kalmanozyma brasiliensis (strain GHG001) TaxID=1365824 RepID=V5GMQ5_KALBG|nr:uncharacterized protein PSEUBRA_003421 [Kalmanozyma brasiliensis GHG001]EST07247.1 hypothetical protein PSEUBRA_003421 [Kalmanozyma brasiliensis GHG001]